MILRVWRKEDGLLDGGNHTAEEAKANPFPSSPADWG